MDARLLLAFLGIEQSCHQPLDKTVLYRTIRPNPHWLPERLSHHRTFLDFAETARLDSQRRRTLGGSQVRSAMASDAGFSSATALAGATFNSPCSTKSPWMLRSCIIIAGLLFAAPPALASLKDIHLEKLPQDAAVLKAYADVATVEDMVKTWHDPWTFDTPRATVAALLKSSLEELAKVNNAKPRNEELLLLIGLVATYAYNADLNGLHGLATDTIAMAKRLAPDDYRPEWFLGNLQCQTLELKQGMVRLLAIESSVKWDQLSAGFWDDYLYCASLTDMPAHALRASTYIAKLNAAPSKDRDIAIDVARKHFITPDPAKNYSWQEMWFGDQVDSSFLFTNTMFGIEVSVPGTWRTSLGDLQKEISTVQLVTGPHPGKNGGVTPNILVFMRAPKEGESLTDFVKSLMPHSSPRPTSVSVCPVEDCLAFADDKANVYANEGGGHAIVTVFQRKSPEFPGLLFEKPSAPLSSGAGQTKYSRPLDRIRRLEGTLYYLVLLDSADSVLKDAKADYESFLKSMIVE
jgi:hypothetical protein